MNRLLLMLCLLPMAASAGSPAWNCRNPHFEAGCSGGQCTAAPPGDFTPMDIAFTEDGSLSACMYSGCWEGDGQAGGDARFLTLVARDLEFHPAVEDPPRRGDLALLLDRDSGTALLSMDPYAQPLVCTRRDPD